MIDELRYIFANFRRFFFEWSMCGPVVIAFVLGEAALCAAIVLLGRYTAIDWRAYMQEVEGPVERDVWDYSQLSGETGPLAYPGGFVYLFAGLRHLAGGDGSDVRTAQWAFAAVYVATSALVVSCYATARPRNVPPVALLLLIGSLRLHSIYLLRLFNDCWAMLLFWAACACFCHARWKLGCIVYSLGVSIKMNLLLSAPGLLLLLLKAKGVRGAIGHIALCALVQLVVGWRFLVANPVAYIGRGFGGFGDLNQKWSVNWKFLPHDLFHSNVFVLLLLALHLVVLAFLVVEKWCVAEGEVRRAVIGMLPLRRPDTSNTKAAARPQKGGASGSKGGAAGSKGGKKKSAPDGFSRRLHPEHVLSVMLGCNAVGVIFSRSLHFQFYCWYAHAVPFLLWRCPLLPYKLKLTCIALLEYAWSYGLDKAEGTSTPLSSLALQLAHLLLLYAITFAPHYPTYEYVGDATLIEVNRYFAAEVASLVSRTGVPPHDAHGAALTDVSADGTLTFQLLDAEGTLVRRATSAKERKGAGWQKWTNAGQDDGKARREGLLEWMRALAVV